MLKIITVSKLCSDKGGMVELNYISRSWETKPVMLRELQQSIGWNIAIVASTRQYQQAIGKKGWNGGISSKICNICCNM